MNMSLVVSGSSAMGLEKGIMYSLPKIDGYRTFKKEASFTALHLAAAPNFFFFFLWKEPVSKMVTLGRK